MSASGNDVLGFRQADPLFHREPSWWRGHSSISVAVVIAIVFVSYAPYIAGYLMAPAGVHFSGAPAYTEDAAQHEVWASQMSLHIWYQNLLTPEPVPRGWFFHPLEFTLGIAQRCTGIAYPLVGLPLPLLCAPLLAFGLMAIARGAGLPFPGFAAIVALLCGSFAPLVHAAASLGFVAGNAERVRSVGAAATPMFAGPGLYLLLAVLVMVALPTGDVQDPTRGFRRAGFALFVLASVYPFFVPTLCLTAVFYACLSAPQWGWNTMFRGLLWVGILVALPMLYWAVLPVIDAEYARFAAGNRQPLFPPHIVLVGLGLGSGGLVGIPLLVRTNAYQRMLACFAASSVVALYIPVHPWRSHILNLSPLLVIAAIAAWWPLLLRLRTRVRWTIAGVLLIGSVVSAPYYYSRYLGALVDFRPPVYLTDSDLNAVRWIARQPGTDVVLARSDLSPWIAPWAQHRVIVGHYLWTHDYQRRRRQVDAVFSGGADPRDLLRNEKVKWVLIDSERGAPYWARGVEPAARFDQTFVLRVDRLLEQLEK